MDSQYIKHMLVRTPLEGPAVAVRYALGFWRRRRHPELAAVHREHDMIPKVLQRVLREDSNSIDVGAHLGSTLSKVMRLAPNGRHIAFEPIERKANWLRRKFPEVEVHCVAVGERGARTRFLENLTRPGFSGFGMTENHRDQWREYDVDVGTLDETIGAEYRPDFMKIDVEGAEYLVLRGGRQVIRRSRPVILFESGPGGAERVGVTRADLYGELTRELGYAVYFLDAFLSEGPPMSWEVFDRAHVYPFRAFNYIAVPGRRKRQ